MASYQNPVVHAVNDVLAVTDYNTLANNDVFLFQRPYINAYNSVSTTIPNATVTQVTLGGLTASGYGFSVNSNNIVVPLTGTYWASWGAMISGYTSTAGVAYASLYHNGSEATRGNQYTPQAGGNEQSSTGSGVVLCSAGDTLSLWTYQGNGSTEFTQNGAPLTYLHVIFMGSQ